MIIFKHVFLLLLAALLITACQDDEAVAPRPTDTPEEKPLVSDRVIVVDSLPGDLQLTRITADQLSFVFTDTAEHIEPGAILVSGSTTMAPYGYLRQVTGKTVAGETVIFKTQPATLRQVFKSLPVHFADSVTLTPTDVPHGRVNNNNTFTISTQKNLQGNTVGLTLTIKPTLEMQWDKDADGKTSLLKFATRVDAEDIALSGNIAKTFFSQPIEMLKFNLPPATFSIAAGPVLIPVVMKNTLAVKVTLSGAESATIGTGLRVENASIYAGVEYSDDTWKPLYAASPPTISMSRPEAGSQLSFTLNPDITIATSPYGIEGFNFYGSGILNNSIAFTPTKVSVSSKPVLESGVNANLFILGNNKFSYSYDNFNEFYKNEWAYSDLPLPGQVQPEGEGAFSKITDVLPDHWAYQEIKALYNAGIVSGYPNNTFRPGQNVTRAEFVTLLVNALDPSGGFSTTFEEITFSDVPDSHWAKENIARATRAGYIRGYDDGTFRPDAFINKVELLIMLTNALQVPSVTEALNEYAIIRAYCDFGDIPDWAVPVVAKATIHEMVMNAPDKLRLRPQESITRDEAVTMLYRGLVWKGSTILDNYDNFYLVEVIKNGTGYAVTGLENVSCF